MVCNGDWHSRLVAALSLAEINVSSAELRTSIQNFREVLLRNDECHQRVTVTRPKPCGLDYQFTCAHIQKAGLGNDITFHHADASQIAITLAMRGSLPYVTQFANTIIDQGLCMAKRALSQSEY